VDNRADDAAFETTFDEIGENALDGIQPQVRGRNEVEPEALVPSARDSAFRSVWDFVVLLIHLNARPLLAPETASNIARDADAEGHCAAPPRSEGGSHAVFTDHQGAALYSLGIPKDSVIEYEAAVKWDKFLSWRTGQQTRWHVRKLSLKPPSHRVLICMKARKRPSRWITSFMRVAE
jgi:hypothetical protein